MRTLHFCNSAPTRARHWLLAVFVSGFSAAALVPVAARVCVKAREQRQLDDLALTAPTSTKDDAPPTAQPSDPALMVRVEEPDGLLASWQTIAGCGSSGATGTAGIKWIGRGTTGGLFNVQMQANYSTLGNAPYQDQNFFFNTLITRDLGQKWNVGINIPYVYKYFNDPFMTYSPQKVPPTPALDVSNAGLGDISLQGTRRFGSINDNALTLSIGLPTGTSTAAYPGYTALGQQRQLGFGKVTAAGIYDHTFDQIWGVIVLGGVAAYRGGENHPLENYRAPSATAYGYTGYFWGPLVPAFGLQMTGFTRHDRDKSQDENSALFVASANFSLEWSTDWIALMAGVQFPYQYVGPTSGGTPVPKWGWGSRLVALGISVSPF
jgi:hypothetical protein